VPVFKALTRDQGREQLKSVNLYTISFLDLSIRTSDGIPRGGKHIMAPIVLARPSRHLARLLETIIAIKAATSASNAEPQPKERVIKAPVSADRVAASAIPKAIKKYDIAPGGTAMKFRTIAVFIFPFIHSFPLAWQK
jgi:hypothetical protein